MSWHRFAYALVCRLRRDRHLDVLATLRASEWWPADRLREAQEARLRALLLHAFEHVPFYREPLLASGVVTNPARPRVDLPGFSRLPLLTRDDVRRRAAELRDVRPSRRGAGISVVASSGTTGDPLRVVRDQATYEAALAIRLWFDEWSGCSLGEPKVVFSGPRQGLRARMRASVVAVLRNETRLDHSRVSPAHLAAYIERINRLRPVQVVGVPWILYEIARYAEAAGRRIVPPRAVVASFEALAPEVETTIGRAFGAPVFNRYGSTELGDVASTCGREPRLHVSALTHHLEVLRDDGRPCAPGETGDLVITHLSNYAMPLIRYRIGDLGTPGPTADPCRCGRALPSIGEVTGRVLDTFVRPDGTLVNGFYIRRFYRSLRGIRQFQVVQLEPSRVHVKLVEQERTADPMATRRPDLTVITAHLRHALGDDCQVTFEFVDEIPRERSGKYRITVRMVPDPHRPAGRGAPAGSPAR